MPSTDERLHSDRIDIVQHFKLSTNVYEVSIDGRTVAWARQKIMALKERIEIWEDDTQTELVCAIQARKVMELRSSYDVVDAAGGRIAVFKKVFGRSFLRSTWQVESVGGDPLATVPESSLAIAIIRRIKGFVDLVPVIGWLLAFIPIPYGFTWTNPATGAVLGEYRRTMGVRDRYVLTLDGDPQRTIDRRAAVALAICLDALQSR